jgi:hypothetical protein
MSRTYGVNIEVPGEGLKHYRPDFQAENRAWKAVLIRARNGATVTCACPGQGAKHLAIRHFDDADLFTLARYPLSGDQHAQDCRFYSPNPKRSGLCGYQSNVVEEGPEGISVRLEIGLTRRTPQAQTTQGQIHAPATTRGRGSQPAMRLLGLLHLLWEEANLNTWWPAMQGKRNQWLVNRELEKAASEITASRVKLNSVLLLPDSRADGDWAKRNQACVRRAVDERRRLIAVVPLMKYSDERAQGMLSALKIAGFHGIPHLSMTPALWNETCRRFPHAITAWQHQQQVMAVAALEIKPGKAVGRFADVVSLALMPVTANWIPFDSMYEKRIADKLTAEGRGFSKPLRYDADNAVIFPDFVLRDMTKETPLEVFGRSDEAYIARKAEKTAYYQAEYGDGYWWCWNAADDPEGRNIPPFPSTDR